MLLRDRLMTRMREMGADPDFTRLAAEVLGIRNAPPALARRLVAQALVVEDRREAWQKAGERICADAPAGPGVYVLRDAVGQVLYVGKANDLRRRLRAHFASRRWKGLKAPLARVASADWEPVGSELEALLREAMLIQSLRPVVNVQVGLPDTRTRVLPSAIRKDTIVLLPSAAAECAELVAAKVDGGWQMLRARRDGSDLAPVTRQLFRFFKPSRRGVPRQHTTTVPVLSLAPIVYSWLAGRGQRATRVDPWNWTTAVALESRLRTLLADRGLFTERIEVR